MRIERLSHREGRRRSHNNCKVRARKLSICLTTARTGLIPLAFTAARSAKREIRIADAELRPSARGRKLLQNPGG